MIAKVKGEAKMRGRGAGGEVLEHTDTHAVRGGLVTILKSPQYREFCIVNIPGH